jgi:hypothetical protein
VDMTRVLDRDMDTPPPARISPRADLATVSSRSSSIDAADLFFDPIGIDQQSRG